MSLVDIVATLVASNFLSLWMMIFIWVDTKASARVVDATIVAATEGTLSLSRYHRKVGQFQRRMANIGNLLNVVVIVCYINTMAFGFILLVCPASIALSYLATFGREPVILMLMLPGIADVNDRHKDLLNAVAEGGSRDMGGQSNLATDDRGSNRFSTYISPDTFDSTVSTPSNPNPTTRAHTSSTTAPIVDTNMESFSITRTSSLAGGHSSMDMSVLVDIEKDSYTNNSSTVILMQQMQAQIDQLKLWVIINNSPLQIPILGSKVITGDNLRTQLLGSVVFVVTIVVKMLFDRYSI